MNRILDDSHVYLGAMVPYSLKEIIYLEMATSHMPLEFLSCSVVNNLLHVEVDFCHYMLRSFVLR